MVCSQSTAFGCGNYCDNLLPCGNHHCKKPCHKISLAQIGHANIFQFNGRDTGQTDEDNEASSSARYKELLDSCDECELPCQKKRFPACPHPCPQLCHPGDCRPCKVLIKRACYCGTMMRVFECSEFNILSEEEQRKVRPCEGPCHRKLPNCTHLCPEICHPGPCPSAQTCRKKVMVRCSCQCLKREWICMDVQAAYRESQHTIKEGTKSGFGLGILLCDVDCERLLEEKYGHVRCLV